MENKNKNTGKFVKGNKAATANKGKQKERTIVKKRLKEIASWDVVESVVEKNIIKLLTSKNQKIMFEATKAFAEFIKPKKRENIHEMKGNIILELHGIQKLPELEGDQKN